MAKLEAVALPIETIARVCHDGKRALAARLGDEVERPWDEISVAQRESVQHRVRLMTESDEYGTVGLGAAHHVHNVWLRRKAEQGWSFGVSENVERREHPGFMSWTQMPAKFKRRDHVFFRIVNALIEDPAQSATALIERVVGEVVALPDQEL